MNIAEKMELNIQFQKELDNVREQLRDGPTAVVYGDINLANLFEREGFKVQKDGLWRDNCFYVSFKNRNQWGY